MRHILIRPVAAMLLLLGVLFSACSGKETQTYEVRGIYVGPAFNGEAIRVDHEAIPGYMDAMEMSIRIRDRQLLQQIQPGDKIRFTLAVTGESAVVQELEKLPADTPLQLSQVGGMQPDSIGTDTSSTSATPADTTQADTAGTHADH